MPAQQAGGWGGNPGFLQNLAQQLAARRASFPGGAGQGAPVAGHQMDGPMTGRAMPFVPPMAFGGGHGGAPGGRTPFVQQPVVDRLPPQGGGGGPVPTVPGQNPAFASGWTSQLRGAFQGPRGMSSRPGVQVNPQAASNAANAANAAYNADNAAKAAAASGARYPNPVDEDEE